MKTYSRVEILLCSFLSLALDGMSGQLHAPATYALWERPQYLLMEVQWIPKFGQDTMEKRNLWFLCCLAHSLVSEILHMLPFLPCLVYCQEHNFHNCTFSLQSVSTKNLIQPHIFQWRDCKPTIFNETGPQHLSWFLFLYCAEMHCCLLF